MSVAGFGFTLQDCPAKPKPVDGMTIVALRKDANCKITSAKILQSSGDPKANAKARSAPSLKSTA
jgi:hypothetical protein